MFHLVEFVNCTPKEVAVVPHVWMCNNNLQCYWPPIKSGNQLQNWVKNGVEPEASWTIYNVRSLHQFGTYQAARMKLKRAEDTSDFVSEEDSCVRKRIRKVLSDSDSTDDDQSLLTAAPPPPVITNSLNTQFLENTNTPYTHHPLTSHHTLAPTMFNLPPPTFNAIPSTSYASPPPTPFIPHATSILHNYSPSLIPSYTTPTPTRPTPTRPTPTGSTHTTPTPLPACSCNNTYLIEILNIVKRNEKQIAENTRMLQQLLRYQKPSSPISHQLPPSFPVALPVNSYDDLGLLESFLLNDSSFALTLPYFTSFGGEDVRATVRAILSKVIGQELALLMNWKGRGLKKAFHTFDRILSLIYHAAKHNPNCTEISITAVEGIVKNWLRFASDRRGGRKARFEDNV